MNQKAYFGRIISMKKTLHYTLLVTVCYSKFEYSNLQLSSNSFAKSGKIEVSVTIKIQEVLRERGSTIVY
jgi:beta-glucosidase